jgi:hypothetical protein
MPARGRGSFEFHRKQARFIDGQLLLDSFPKSLRQIDVQLKFDLRAGILGNRLALDFDLSP